MIAIFNNILGRFSRDLAIDLGTANTLVHVRGKGIVIREPSIICRHKKTKKILAIGQEAKKMLGRTPVSIEVLRPLRGGVISDFDTTSAMLGYFVHKVHKKPGRSITFVGPRVIIGVPSGISEVEKRAVLDAASAAGAREVFLIEEGLAAALGAGLPVVESVGSMVVDIGGGTSEIAVLSWGGVVVGKSLKVGGDAMDEDIISYVRTRWGLVIGERSAEEIKISLGSAYVGEIEKELVIRGRDLERGMPRTIRLNSVATREALAPSVNLIVEAVKDTIKDAPPELASDIAERGIMLCGGGAKLTGLAKLISKETKLPVTVADDPLVCVVLGAAKVLENPGFLKKVNITTK